MMMLRISDTHSVLSLSRDTPLMKNLVWMKTPQSQRNDVIPNESTDVSPNCIYATMVIKNIAEVIIHLMEMMLPLPHKVTLAVG